MGKLTRKALQLLIGKKAARGVEKVVDVLSNTKPRRTSKRLKFNGKTLTQLRKDQRWRAGNNKRRRFYFGIRFPGKTVAQVKKAGWVWRPLENAGRGRWRPMNEKERRLKRSLRTQRKRSGIKLKRWSGKAKVRRNRIKALERTIGKG